jgi:hypothetical protein
MVAVYGRDANCSTEGWGLQSFRAYLKRRTAIARYQGKHVAEVTRKLTA